MEVLGEYVNSSTNIEVKCVIHNEVIESSPSHILRGRNLCKKCNAEYLSKSQRKDEKLFKEELKSKHGGKIVTSSPYVNTHKKIDLECKVCNTSFRTSPNAVLRLSGCPTCAESKGESFIRSILLRLNEPFEMQKGFIGCKYKRQLYYDFYLPDREVLIEYDGKQHYEPIEFFGGYDTFQDQLSRDKVKNDYAKDNGYTLIRIPYNKNFNEVESKLNELIEGGSSKVSK